MLSRRPRSASWVCWSLVLASEASSAAAICASCWRSAAIWALSSSTCARAARLVCCSADSAASPFSARSPRSRRRISRSVISFCASAVRSCSEASRASSSFERSRSAPASCAFCWPAARAATLASSSVRTVFSASMSRRRLSSSFSCSSTFSLSAVTVASASRNFPVASLARAVSWSARAASSPRRVRSVSRSAIAACSCVVRLAAPSRNSAPVRFSTAKRSLSSLTCCCNCASALSRPESASDSRNCPAVNTSSTKMMTIKSWASASTKPGQISMLERRERRVPRATYEKPQRPLSSARAAIVRASRRISLRNSATLCARPSASSSLSRAM